MQLRDSPSRYGTVSRLNHWLGALLLLAMLAIGLYFTDLPPGAERIFWRTLHIAIGTVLLPLVAFRVLWRLAARAPDTLADAPIERRLAAGVHVILLLLVSTMLISGVLMQWFGGRPIGIYEVLKIASPLAESELWHDRMEQLHGIAAWTLIALLVLHLAGIARHRHEAIARMLGRAGQAPKRRT